jgi:hypothetical protein
MLLGLGFLGVIHIWCARKIADGSIFAAIISLALTCIQESLLLLPLLQSLWQSLRQRSFSSEMIALIIVIVPVVLQGMVIADLSRVLRQGSK